jgi:hypothetical protein
MYLTGALPSQRAAWVGLAVLIAGLSSAEVAAQVQTAPAPKRVFPDSTFVVDDILTRPYSTEVPFGAVGNRLWASSPQGWGFGDDVHWLYLTNLRAMDLLIRDELGPIVPAQAVYFPSHIHLEGAARAVSASASFTFRTDKVENPLAQPFTPEKRWTCWSSGKRDDWYALDFGAARPLEGLRVWFFDDAGKGGCRAPERVVLERWENGEWKPVELTNQVPPQPAAGENVLSFATINASKLRLVFRNAGARYYTGLYGVEPVLPKGSGPGELPVELQVTADKFITDDDILVAIVRVRNPTEKAKVVEVVPVPDWQGQFEGQALSNREESKPSTNFGPWSFLAESRGRVHNFELRQLLRFAVTHDPIVPLPVNESRYFTVASAYGHDQNAADFRRAFGFRYSVSPGETLVFKSAFEMKPPNEPSTINAVVAAPTAFTRTIEAGTSQLGSIAAERQDNRDPLVGRVNSSQAWYDANLAAFQCSDPMLQKMFYHRAYTLRKNMMNPQLGSLRWPTQSEGRWRSTWYPNVISYGAAHQIREARWLANSAYWTGHLRTWANNQKADHVYPSHVTPAGPSDGQYTDWITSTAWDGFLVHPDKALLAELVDKLADNVRGWQQVYDSDGDGLLMVDSHWWTGMEYQPSFFFFSEYQTSADFYQPAKPVNLERVDLTAFNFGNAQTVARIYKLLNQPEKAKEFDALAQKIASAVGEKMWDKEKRFFYSLRADDDVPATVKEVIGVYPFYFGMLSAGKGFEAAWDSILDPGQFWTPWPVASVSKECPAYSQDGWPQAQSRAVACMWNGPTWPHANSIVLSAMARTLRSNREAGTEKSSLLTREKLWELFTSFTKAQYREQDPVYPWTGEFYNGESGVWKTAERDYNHSTWLDILIPEIVGLVPRDDEILEIDPLMPPGALSHFTLDGQRYHGHDITIVWDAPDDDDRHGDGRSGLDVYVDGRLVAENAELARLRIDLKTGKVVDNAK